LGSDVGMKVRDAAHAEEVAATIRAEESWRQARSDWNFSSKSNRNIYEIIGYLALSNSGLATKLRH